MQLILCFTFLSCLIFAENSDLPGLFSNIAKKTFPAVVIIETEDSEGSGFLIREDGHVLTSSHLLENARSIHVITYDKHVFPAQIVKLDIKTDLAVIKIEGSGFFCLSFGNSDELEIGEPVLSIGYHNSCELGTVLDKKINHIGLFQTEDFIKTSAHIYLGTSGGPLVNAKGEVVGINAAALIDREGNYLGESLAISSNQALAGL